METTSYIDEQLRLLVPIALEGGPVMSKEAWMRIDALLDCRQTLIKMGEPAVKVEVEFNP